jgi:hypothetical protein
MPSLGCCCTNSPGNQSDVQFVERGLNASERKESIALLYGIACEYLQTTSFAMNSPVAKE